MWLSTKGRYGLTAMLDIAIHDFNGPVSLKSIAERQKLSESYLEQLINSLKKAKLVKSARGSHGGYALAKDMHSISVGEILRALEGSLAPVHCADETKKAIDCKSYEFCVTRVLWEKIRDSIYNVVDNTTLGNLVEEHVEEHNENIQKKGKNNKGKQRNLISSR
jgi:Rrf2 family protein